MTAQIEDQFIHEDARYLITEARGGAFHLCADLGVPLDFTGTIWAGDDFIDDLYVHLGFQASHAYSKVLCFQFERGVLIAVEDRSAEMMLERMDRGYRPNPEEYEALFEYLQTRTLAE